ncbi:MAG TPA: serine hydrolase domain-containing protein [Phycisphaerae bacterium]|nr:serine hydrolase domain-containing protein [Phycisphaerae bacterium]
MNSGHNRLARWPILLAVVGLAWFPSLGAASEGGAFPVATPESQGLSSEALQELAGEVRGLFEAGRIVGAELLVVKNRRTVLHESVGWKDLPEKVPMEPNTIFNIRSMTKPIVGTAVQMLIDDGRLSLDDRAAKFFPSFDNDKSGKITIDHLLTHRSGFPQASPPKPLTQYKTLRGLADYWGERGPDQFEPGNGFTYSDPGVDILGAIVTEVSGLPLERFVTQRLFEPAGMADSFAMTRDFAAADNHDPRRRRISSNHTASLEAWYRYWKPTDGPMAPFVKGSGTTWYSTPLDYARFLALWMDKGVVGGRRLLAEATVKRALMPVSGMAYPTNFRGLHVFYGRLWILHAEGESPGEAKPVVFGHAGSDGTWAWAWPKHDLMVLYFTQSRGNRTGILLESAIERLLIEPTITRNEAPDQPAAVDS